MIDDVPCFEENQTLSTSLAKFIPHTDPFPRLLCVSSALPFSRPREFFHKQDESHSGKEP